jgi:hypothetical protein
MLKKAQYLQSLDYSGDQEYNRVLGIRQIKKLGKALASTLKIFSIV